MSNAAKKIRLIQQLTHASATTASSPSTATSVPTASQQYIHKSPCVGQLPPYTAAPAPTSGASQNYIRYLTQRNQYYANMLKSARQALHTLQAQQRPVATNVLAVTTTSSPTLPQTSSPAPSTPTTPNMPQQPQCAMPCGGFLVLNPNDAHPTICMPASPPPSTSQRARSQSRNREQQQIQCQQTPRTFTPTSLTPFGSGSGGAPHQQNQNYTTSSSAIPKPPPVVENTVSMAPPQPRPMQNMFLPIFPVNAPMQQVPTTPKAVEMEPVRMDIEEEERRSTSSINMEEEGERFTPLKKEYLEKLPQDSRLARWQRVLAYIRGQRNSASGLSPDIPSTSSTLSSTHHPRASTSDPSSPLLSIKPGKQSCHSLLPLTTFPTPTPTTPYNSHSQNPLHTYILDPNAPIPATFSQHLREEDTHTLWSGGSAGTAGIDEFVWDEDLPEHDPATAPGSGAVTPHAGQHHFNGFGGWGGIGSGFGMGGMLQGLTPWQTPGQTPRRGRSIADEGEMFELEREREEGREERKGDLRQGLGGMGAGAGCWISLAPVEMGVRA